MNTINELMMLKLLASSLTGLPAAELKERTCLAPATFDQVSTSLAEQGYIGEIPGTGRWCILDPGKVAWQSLRQLLNEGVEHNADERVDRAEANNQAAQVAIKALEDKVRVLDGESWQRDRYHRFFAIAAGLFAAAFVELITYWFWDFFSLINRPKSVIAIHASLMIFVLCLVPILIYRKWLTNGSVAACLALLAAVIALIFTP